jgi:hypothetical protein
MVQSRRKQESADLASVEIDLGLEDQRHSPFGRGYQHRLDKRAKRQQKVPTVRI